MLSIYKNNFREGQHVRSFKAHFFEVNRIIGRGRGDVARADEASRRADGLPINSISSSRAAMCSIPAKSLRGKRDIGIRWGVIDAIEPDIAAARALKTIDANGKLVTPR